MGKILTGSALVFSISVMSGVNATLAADVVNGKKLSKSCIVCHGKLGIGKDPEVPNLAGQSAFYIEKSLVDYQTGKREDRRMNIMAKPLSKDEIRDLAAWYESLKVTVEESEETAEESTVD